MTEGFPITDREGGALSLEGEPLPPEPQGDYGMPKRRAPRLSREDVLEAADALLQAGERVTIDRVRTRLGRGSPNTIQEHLEGWWGQLASRLKDLPGREFPDIPNQVGRDLKRLWDTALASAREELKAQWATHESALDIREASLAAREAALAEAEASLAAREETHEHALDLAREQLIVANNRTERLEVLLETREASMRRLERRVDEADSEAKLRRDEHQAALSALETQREKLEIRYEASESRWLQEVDRARQALKAATREQERLSRISRRHVEAMEKSQAQLKRELAQVRGDLKAALSAAKRLPTTHSRTKRPSAAAPLTKRASRGRSK